MSRKAPASPAGNGLEAQLRANLAPGPGHESAAPGRPAPANPPVKLIAFYLPQFHPIPENNRWWGEGFTEWTNVTRALPQFVGHYQPHLPGALGFYDLRMAETLRAQARLARRYGLHGFCLHYYYFGGHKLLDTPLKLLLANPDIDLPFCLCWANENWTRRWDGLDQDILMAQNYSAEDDRDFIRSIEPAMRDPRYIRINGRPLLLLYRPGLLPDALATGRRWRVHCAEAGLEEPYIVMVQCFGDEDPRPYGFDAAVEFPPHKLGFTAPRINGRLRFFDAGSNTVVSDYSAMARAAAEEEIDDFTLFRGVCPSWDNEARKPGRGHVFANATPERYEAWLKQACAQALAAPEPDERLVFINAWNEWAEGAHLEPDRHFGHAFLNATARALNALAAPSGAGRDRLVVVSHDAYPHGAQYLALHIVEELVRRGADVRVLLGGPGPMEERFAAAAPTERIETEYRDPAAWKRAGMRLRTEGFNAAICNTTVAAQAIPPLQEAGVRTVSLIHELPAFLKERGLGGAARAAATLADAVVFASPVVRDAFVQVAGPIAGKTVIRPQGLYFPPAAEEDGDALAETARAALKAAPTDRILLGCGYGDRRKGLDLWPALIRTVCAACPEALFVWAGKIEPEIEQLLRDQLTAAGLLGRLRLPGHIADLRPLYCAAELFLLTSREDPFPSVALEAMAHGVPVIAFEGGGGITSLVREVGGRLPPLADVDALAAETRRLLENEAARRKLADASRQRLKQGFSFAEYVDDLRDLALGARLKVSVVVPNYNYAVYLRERVESIRRQTYPVHEIILLDDASTDDSRAVIAELERDSGGLIRAVLNDDNSGAVARQWARGVALATGDLVWIAEADDLAAPDFLADVVAAFEDPEVVLSYSESRQIDEHGAVLADDYLAYVEDIDPDRWRADYQRDGAREIAEALSVKNTIPNVSAAVFRREPLQAVMQEHLDEFAALRNAADWCCYLYLLAQGRIAFTAKSLNQHRRHQRSVTLSANDRRHLDEIAAMQRLAARLVTVPPGKQETASRWYEQVARRFGLDPVREEAAPASGQAASCAEPG